MLANFGTIMLSIIVCACHSCYSCHRHHYHLTNVMKLKVLHQLLIFLFFERVARGMLNFRKSFCTTSIHFAHRDRVYRIEPKWLYVCGGKHFLVINIRPICLYFLFQNNMHALNQIFKCVGNIFFRLTKLENVWCLCLYKCHSNV